MSVKPHPKEPGAWIIDCYPEGRKGKRQRVPFRGTEAEAREVEADLLRSVKQRILTTIPKISDLYIEWLAWYRHEVARSTFLDAITCFKKLLPHFGAIRPNLMTQQHVDAYKQGRLQTVSKRTVTKELVYLSVLIKWAVARRYCLQPAVDIRGYSRKQTAPAKPRPLTREEVNRILDAIEPRYRLILLLMCDAGMRRNEALHVRIQDVDMQYGLIRVVGKGNKEAVVPVLTDRLFEELACKMEGSRVGRPGGFLSLNPDTGKPYYSIRKALARAAKKAGLPQHLHHHLLRHTFGTLAVVSGMAPHAIKGIMRHSDLSTTLLYQHLAADYLIEEGKKFRV